MKIHTGLNLGLLAILLTGCIIIPRFYETPFPPEKIGFIKPGITTLEDIEDRLGNPDVVRGQNTIWIYSAMTVNAMVLTHGGGGDIREGHWFLVESSNGIVERIKLNKYSLTMTQRDSECSVGNLCISDGWTFFSECFFCSLEATLFDHRAVLLALKEEDEIAKKFQAPESGCGIYVFSEGSLWYGPTRTLIGANSRLPLNHEGYFYIHRPPGVTSLTAWSYRTLPFKKPKLFWIANSFEILGEKQKQLDCHSGELIFVEISHRSENAEFTIVSEYEGKAAIRDRYLIFQ